MPSKQQRQKRIKQTHDEFEKTVHDAVQEQLVQSLDDSELFIIDRSASKAGKKKVETELKPKEAKTFLGPTEKVLVNKAIKKRARAEDDKESIMDFAGRKYGDRYVDLVPRGKRTTTTSHGKVELALEDLWGESIGEKDVPLTVAMTKTPFHDPELCTAITIPNSIPKYRRKELKAQDKALKERKEKRTMKIALPGQSYNPAAVDHQNALAEALAIEMKHQEQIENNRKEKFYGENQKQIAALLLDEEKDSDEEDDDLLLIDDNETEEKVKKVKKALTKAQRNKKRARKQADHEELLIRRDAQLLKSIDKVDKISKQHKEEIEKQKKTKKAKEAIKKQTEEEKRKGLSAHEVASIPLTDELSGSLRALIPKGIAIVDRTCQLEEKGDVFNKTRRNSRKIENPHGARKVTWIPKYKAGIM